MVTARLSRWNLSLGALAAIGLAIRLGAVAGRPSLRVGGDAAFYHGEANLLVAGRGWIDPFIYQATHTHVQSASFPPLFTVLLGMASLLGAKSFLAQRIWCCLIGSSAVVLAGLTGKTVAGRRVGLISAALVAIYPNLWMSSDLGLSETLSPVAVLAVLFAAYRFWQCPTIRRSVVLGGTLALAALARDELAVLAVLLVLPLVV
nr:glycosyltransferase family 39 protein [Actinomycetota bacterium]